jgi:indolepyruvate ferredoxin oxidoreductase beta subunit
LLRDGPSRLRGEAKPATAISSRSPSSRRARRNLSILPALGRAVLRFVARRGWSEKSWPMRVRTTGVGGYLRLKFLASMRTWRPRSLRYADEQAWIERWLALVERTLAVDPAFAREVIETARLVKGYGETYKRGHGNWLRIVDEVINRCLPPARPRASLPTPSCVPVAALADRRARHGRVIDSVRAFRSSAGRRGIKPGALAPDR